MPKIYGSSEIWGDLLVTGSFSILGSASVINTTSLVVSDTIIALGHSQSGSPILDEGFMFVRGTGATQAFIWDESDDTFALISTTEDHTVIGDMNISGYSNLRVGGLTTSTVKITDGASNGYFLQSDASGNATWASIPVTSLTVDTTPVSSGTNGRVFFQELGVVKQDGSLFWDNATKRLGIGLSASTPQNALQVYGSNATFALRVGQNTLNTDGSWTGISFFNSTTVTGGNTSTGQANIKVYRYTGGLGGEMEFNLGSTSIMRLVKEGYVGVGVITPSATLDIVSTTSSAVEINNTSTFLPSGSKYGINSTVGGSNFSLTNYGLYQSVSGASTANYGAFSYVSGTYGSSKSGFYAQVTDSNSTNTENSAFSGYIGGGWKNTGLSLNLGGISSVNDDAGVFVFLSSLSSSQSTSHGSYIWNNSTKNNKYGSTIRVDGNNLSSYNYGIYSQTSGGSILNYGILNQVSGTYGTLYGIQNNVSSSGNTNTQIASVNTVTGGTTYNIAERNQIIGSEGTGYRQVQQNILGSLTGISGDVNQYNLVGSDVISSSLTNIYNMNIGSASIRYGMYNSIPYGQSSIIYGINNLISSTNSNTIYGLFNQLYGSGEKYGTYNNLDSGTYSYNSYGTYNTIQGDGFKFGIYNDFTGTYSSTRYGVYTTSTGNNTDTYGEYIRLIGTGSNNYGIYIDSFSASNNYGIVVNRGDVVFNESGENYNFRVEGMTQSHLLYVDAYRERVYMGTTTSTYLSSFNNVNFTSLVVNTKSASHSVGYYSETSGGDVENYGYLSYLVTSKTHNSNTGFYSTIVLSSATESTNYGYYSDIGGTGNDSANVGLFSKLTSVGQSNLGVAIDVSGATSNTGISVDVNGASATAIITTRGNIIFNENGLDYDFRVEGDTDQNLLFTDASTDRIGVGTASPQYKLQVLGTVSTTGFRMTNGASNGFVLSSNSDGVGSWTSSTRDLSFGHSSISPTGSTTYHIGMVPQLQPTTTDQVSRRIRSPYRGEITSVSIMWSLTTNGSSEAVTYQIHNITQATSATVTSAAQLTGDSQNTYTLGSPLAVSENDDLQIRWVTPVWATKPTSVIHVITARIRVY